MPHPDMRSAALAYVRAGHAVFELQPGSKRPYRKSRGLHEATTDIETIRHWWTVRPDSNIAIRPDEDESVLDVDTRYDGHASFADRLIQLGALPGHCPIARTPTRGLHIWLKHEHGGDLVNSFGRGIDVKGHNGYLVVPPSVIEVRVDWDDKLLLPRGSHRYTWKVPLP